VKQYRDAVRVDAHLAGQVCGRAVLQIALAEHAALADELRKGGVVAFQRTLDTPVDAQFQGAARVKHRAWEPIAEQRDSVPEGGLARNDLLRWNDEGPRDGEPGVMERHQAGTRGLVCVEAVRDDDRPAGALLGNAPEPDLLVGGIAFRVHVDDLDIAAKPFDDLQVPERRRPMPVGEDRCPLRRVGQEGRGRRAGAVVVVEQPHAGGIRAPVRQGRAEDRSDHEPLNRRVVQEGQREAEPVPEQRSQRDVGGKQVLDRLRRPISDGQDGVHQPDAGQKQKGASVPPGDHGGPAQRADEEHRSELESQYVRPHVDAREEIRPGTIVEHIAAKARRQDVLEKAAYGADGRGIKRRAEGTADWQV